jgi:hypothetical protein
MGGGVESKGSAKLPPFESHFGIAVGLPDFILVSDGQLSNKTLDRVFVNRLVDNRLSLAKISE